MAEFTSNGGDFVVTKKIVEAFENHGYILVRGLLSQDEVKNVKKCMEESKDIQAHAYGRSDGQGAKSKMCVWNQPGDDVCGVLARTMKVAGTMEALLGGQEIYHYHSKLMMKEAKTGGAHLWHQDYGYWYQNGCLFPYMGSVFLPVDKCTKENSCLQVLAGSHKMGRIEHHLIGQQSGADLQRVDMAKNMCEHVYVEMEPGDGLFFHCNLLHTSDQNKSDMRRWVLITSFNQARNNPTKDHHHPRYTPMEKVVNSRLLECKNFNSTTDKSFMDPARDSSAASLPRKEE